MNPCANTGLPPSGYGTASPQRDCPPKPRRRPNSILTKARSDVLDHATNEIAIGSKLGIPDEIRETDHLTTGDSFELERLTPGHYLLTKQPPPGARFTVAIGEDGLPVIRPVNGLITSRLVKDIERQTP